MQSAMYQYLPLIHIFRVVIEQGSFQGAANVLELPRSSVSKKVQQLEAWLGEPLITRSTRKLMITDFGAELLRKSEAMSALLSGVNELAYTAGQTPQGRVSISSSALLGQTLLLPLLPQLRAQYPGIQLDISFNDQTVDLIEQGIDIALRIGNLPDSSLVAKQIGIKQWGWFASPSYLRSSPALKTPEDLAQHRCLVFKNNHHALRYWPFQSDAGDTRTMKVEADIFTDSSRALIDMACAGLGIIMVDAMLVGPELQRKQLVPVLSDWRHPEPVPIHLISLGRKQRSYAADCIWRALTAAIDLNPLPN
ncbi:LysR family transcriptional regulator [Photobacterium sp. MCCC 1A19761]|uniref:LysR family transcriptional regulator n=1 Tax=Photobacterium sp. MCCC 1A19761 TaxID=3115000 RepID=UPI00307D7E71